jgi:hypothetical protein
MIRSKSREIVAQVLFSNIYIDFRFIKYIIKHELDKMQAGHQRTRSAPVRWIDALEEEDVTFIKRFVLASGSLKELASVYGISYPTVRLRLDRLIQKIQLLEHSEVTSPFERLLRLQHADGKIDHQTLKLLLESHRAELAGRNEE